MRCHVPRGLVLVVAILAGSLAGCKTWQPVNLAPARVVAEDRPSSVRITDSRGLQLTLSNPIVVNDSIVSAGAGPSVNGYSPPRMGVPTHDVRSLEVAEFSAARTIVMAVGIAAVSAAMASAAGDSEAGNDLNEGPLPKSTSLIVRGIRYLLGMDP